MWEKGQSQNVNNWQACVLYGETFTMKMNILLFAAREEKQM